MDHYKLPVITPQTLNNIKEALKNNQTSIEISFDLNLSTVNIKLDPKGNLFFTPDGQKVSIPEKYRTDEKIVYFIKDNLIFPLKLFDHETNFYYKLVSTSWRPILRISATQMHKKPFLDEIEKCKLSGFVLDGGTGLGYSAIIASKTAIRVTTIEWDLNVLEIARYNPHSIDLFNSSNIEVINDDITERISYFDDNYFDNIVQDGGMPKSSGNFFSYEQCIQLHRVLKKNGFLYFYLPKHGKSKGRDFGKEHLDRLAKAGLKLKKRDKEGSYAILYKP